MIFRPVLLYALIAFLSLNSSYAQTTEVKSPDEFLRYKLGSRFTPHHQLVDYFQYVDGLSDKVQLIEYGQTYELRPLMAAIISSPANLQRIESIRQNNLRRTGMLNGDAIDEHIAIVHLSYSVHGNEAAGSESSMAVLYDLVKGGTPYDAWLNNTIVIIDPCLNPDGYNRYSQWSNSVSANPFNPRPETRDHSEPWPGGRSNHYYFDLNRDWAWQTQQESRDRIAFYLKWMPHVHADIHEMGAEAPYYFAPAAQPYHPYVTSWQSSFQIDIGKNHATHFDKEGWRYFTKERFDLFYPSYGDTYPTFAGAIGMTYEQGGGGYANRAVILEHGDTLTLYDRIAHHRASSLSTIEVSSKNASSLVKEFEMYFKKTIADPPGHVNSYVIPKSNNPGRVADLLKLLDLQGITYGTVKDEKRALKGYSYVIGGKADFTAQPGDIIIPASQPRAVLIQVLFEPAGTLVDSLTYDITAWSLPMAYGLEVYSSDVVISYVPYEDLKKVDLPKDAKPYAYALPWGSVSSAKSLVSLQSKGIIARYASQVFEVEGVQFPAGTVLFMRADNRKFPQFDEAIKEVASTTDTEFKVIHTGFVSSGKDFGSDDYTLVREPEVLAFSGRGVSSLNLGEVWHFFEEELNYPLHLVDINDKDDVTLGDFNVILLTEGYYDLQVDFLEKLNSWVNSGGRLIVIGSGISKIAGKESFGIEYATSSVSDSLQREAFAHTPDEYSSGERKSLSEEIPGAIFRTKMDSTHPLTFGLGKTYWTLKTNVSFYARLKNGTNALYLDDAPLHYGFAGYKALEKTKNSLVAGQENRGAGSIVYLVDNPMFRSFWNSGKVLFCNAMLF